MRSKVLILVAALVFGAVAALAAVLYVGGARRVAEAQDKSVEVLVAKQDIPRGLPIGDIMSAGMLVAQEVPRKYVAAGAISTTRTLEGRVLADSISKGEQLTQSRFEFPSSAGLSFTVPKGFLALSLPYTETRGVGGLLKPGDSVAVVVTTEKTSEKPSTTRILIPKAKVLAIGQTMGTAGSGGSGAGNTLQTGNRQQQTTSRERVASITLALTPTDLEKVVFAQENERIWMSLLSQEGQAPTGTSGETELTLFSR